MLGVSSRGTLAKPNVGLTPLLAVSLKGEDLVELKEAALLPAKSALDRREPCSSRELPKRLGESLALRSNLLPREDGLAARTFCQCINAAVNTWL